MTDEVNGRSLFDEFDDDPDNPVSSQSMRGKLTVSALVDVATDRLAPSYGAENDKRIIETIHKYTDKIKYNHPVWYLEAEGVDVKREDGAPFRQHEILKLRSNEGNKLGNNQAHAKLAVLFSDLGVTAGYTHVGEPDSAVGREFQFADGDIDLGRGYKKHVNLFPRELYTEPYTGEVRIVKAKASEGAATGPQGPASMPEGDAISILTELLDGKRPSQMFDIVTDDGRLKSVATIFGVPLLDGLSDESIVSVLRENHVMELADDGTLRAMSTVSA